MVSGHTSLGGTFPLVGRPKNFQRDALEAPWAKEKGKVNEMVNLVVWKGPRERTAPDSLVRGSPGKQNQEEIDIQWRRPTESRDLDLSFLKETNQIGRAHV